MTLADYQRTVAAAIGAPLEFPAGSPCSTLRGAAVIRWSVLRWATAQLREVCPLTTTLLRLDDRLDDAVRAHVAREGRTSALHEWGLDFLEITFRDDDALVADVARLEHAMTAPPRRRLPLPEPWPWSRQPSLVVLSLMSGQDPRGLPEQQAPTLVARDASGRLVTS